MRLVPSKLNLPLFLVTRNRLKRYNPDAVRIYLCKKQKFYNRRCQKEPEYEEANKKKVKHIIGHNEEPSTVWCSRAWALRSVSRDLVRHKPWQLKPNRYKLPAQIYASQKGAGGAHWAKIGENKAIQPLNSASTPGKLYDVPRESDRMMNIYNKHKGVFMSNARNRVATARSMVSDTNACYRNATDPGPTRYYPKLHELNLNVSPKIEQGLSQPHDFLRNSCVPNKLDAIYIKNSSLKAGPGRYDARLQANLPCDPKLIYHPDLQAWIEREKRFKFRRLPYKKINKKLYCSSNMRNVPYNGHHHLFKGYEKKISQKKALNAVKGGDYEYVRQVDGPYINMINSPNRQPISLRMDPLPSIPKKVMYHYHFEPLVHKHLENNKKIAFLSGEHRFKGVEDHTQVMTFSQLQKLKDTLPIERQLRDHPVMQKEVTEIKPKFMEIPPPSYELELPKRHYKFLPLPTLKVLFRDTEMDVNDPNERFYTKRINIMNFLKKDSTISSLEEIFPEMKDKNLAEDKIYSMILNTIKRSGNPSHL